MNYELTARIIAGHPNEDILRLVQEYVNAQRLVVALRFSVETQTQEIAILTAENRLLKELIDDPGIDR